MRTALGIALLALALHAPRALGAAIIDTGFTMDGKATYCHGPAKDEGPLVFEDLAVASIGQCPIDVQMQLSATTVAPSENLDVKWFATIHGAGLAVNLLPSVAKPPAKNANPVKTSMLRACPAGTNCAAAGVVVPTAIAGDATTDDGAFDASGTKQLKSYRFQFPTAGKYIVVGVVSVMGDKPVPAEFVVFQTVEVGATAGTNAPNTTAPIATVAPATDAPVANDADPPTTPTPPSTPPASTTNGLDTGVKASSEGGGGGVNWQTVGIVAVVVIACAVGFVLNYERRDLQRMQRARAFRAERTPQSPGSRRIELRSDAGMTRVTSLSKPTGSPLSTAAYVSPRKKAAKSTASQAPPSIPMLRSTNANSSYDQRSSRMQSNVFQASMDSSVDSVGEAAVARPRRSTVALLEASPTGSDAWSIGSLQDGNAAELSNSRPSHYSFL